MVTLEELVLLLQPSAAITRGLIESVTAMTTSGSASPKAHQPLTSSASMRSTYDGGKDDSLLWQINPISNKRLSMIDASAAGGGRTPPPPPLPTSEL
jgi:hypothetical protein